MGAMGRPAAAGRPRENAITARFTEQETQNLDQQRAMRGFGDRSAYLRHLVREDGRRLQREHDERGRF